MADWVLLSLISALGLGVYESLKKRSVEGNSALVTLFCATSSGGGLCLALLIWRAIEPNSFVHWVGDFPDPSPMDHLLIFSKAALVSCSWIFSYFSLKHLPLAIVSPLRSSAPIWTLGVAWFALREVPNLNQLLAFSLTLACYIWFSLLGKRDGLRFMGNPWVLCILLGTWLGAFSAVYDKWLIQVRGLSPISILLHFSVGMVLFQGATLLIQRRIKKESTPFQWRWSIPFVGLVLLISDAFYFHALQDPEALVALVSATRRSSLLVSFLLSLWVLKEAQAKGKIWPVLGVFVGLCWLSLSG